MHQILFAEQGLGRTDREAIGIIVGIAARERGVHAVVAHIAAQADIGQQAGAALHRFFLTCLQGRAGGGILRVVGLGIAEHIGQVGGLGSGCQSQGQCKKQRFELHVASN